MVKQRGERSPSHSVTSVDADSGTVTESRAEIAVLSEYDVVIAGGGTAGTVAAIAAARNGADTLILEYFGFLGGTATGGFLTKPQGPLDFGIRRELYERVKEAGGASDHYYPEHEEGWAPRWWSSSDVEQLKLEAIDMVREAEADVLFYTQVANVVVDATGDGDVAAMAGASFTFGRDGEHAQPMTLMFKVNDVDLVKHAEFIMGNPDEFHLTNVPKPEEDALTPEDLKFELFAEGYGTVIEDGRDAGYDIPRSTLIIKTARGKHEISCNVTRIVEGVGTDASDLSDGVIEGYRQIREYIHFFRKFFPGFEGAYVSGISPFFGVRETRHIEGEYTLTHDDIMEGRDFEDSIGVGECIVDIHPSSDEAIEHEPLKGHGIPYRCLLPKPVDGLLVCGQCISVDHLAHGSTRLIPTAMLTGEGAGTAAALAAGSQFGTHDMDIALLRETLADQGITLHVKDAEGSIASPTWEI